MPRFQLLVREPGKEPHSVPLGDSIVVGRSRSVDLTVDDEEVGRKQFRIGVTSGFVVLEGLGATNPTRVDNGVIKSGEKTTLPAGASIKVGNTEFTVEATDATDQVQSNPTDPVDRTMVAPAPGPGPGPGPAEAEPAPLNTMEFRPPGLPGGVAPPVTPTGQGTSTGARPGAPVTGSPAAGPPAAGPKQVGPKQSPPADGDFGQTMAKGFRPGGPVPPAPAPTPTPAYDANPGNTLPGGPPMGGPGGASPPVPKAPAPQPPQSAPKSAPTPPVKPPQAAPKPAPKQPAATPAPTPTPPPPAASPVREKPKTVSVRPEEMAQPSESTAVRDDLESRLHQSTPRLFVKGEGLKRPVRLLKANNKIGRAETADVLLPHESVSEQHAEIRFDGEQWTLLDLGSTNGSVVDGEHLRGNAQPMRRNTLIGIGALHLIFLYVDQTTAAQDRRDEDRALQLLTKSGRIDKSTANDIRQMVRSEASQSIAEIVLRDTPLAPTDWANAVAAARKKVSLLGRILRIFGIG